MTPARLSGGSLAGGLEAGQGRAQFFGARRFAEQAVYLGRTRAILLHERAPAGEHHDGCSRGLLLEYLGDLPAIHVGHAQISDDHVEGPAPLAGGPKRINSRLASIADLDSMSITLEHFLEQIPQQRLVINAQDLPRGDPRAVVFAADSDESVLANGKDKTERSAF